MIRKLVLGCLLATGLLAARPDVVRGQSTNPPSDQSGSAAASWLLLPSTARASSLGSATTSGVSGMNGIEAAFENPASLTVNEGTSALFSRMNYVADIGVNTFGIAQRLGSNQIALTVSAWDFGDIPETSEELPDVTELTPTWSATYLSAGLTYARMFTDRISAGITAKLVSETMASDMSANTVAFDAGMTYTVGESGLRFGVSLKNFGPALKYGGDGLVRTGNFTGEGQSRTVVIDAEQFELPSLLNFGVSYRRDVAAGATVTVLANFRSNSFENDQLSGGLELGLRDVLYVRGGYQWQQNLDKTFFDGWNVGAGLNVPISGRRLTVDYGYRPTLFDNVQMVTASFTL